MKSTEHSTRHIRQRSHKMAETRKALAAAEKALDEARKASPLFAGIKEKVEHNEYWAREGHMVDVMRAEAELKKLYAQIDETEEVKPFVEKYNEAYIARCASFKK